MSVQNVVLGELIKRRGYGYGYELRDQLREFSEVLGYSDTFVYACLDALERRGLVRVISREEPAAGKRQASSRVYYEATAEGERRFREWMADVPGKAPLREGLHMQLMSAEPDDVPQLIVALGEFEEQCREQLRRLIERPLGTHHARGRSAGATAVQDALVSHLQASMEWAQRTRRSYQTLLEHPTGIPGRHRP